MAQGASCFGAPGSALSGCNVALDDLLPTARVRALLEEVLGSRSQLEQIEPVYTVSPSTGAEARGSPPPMRCR